MTKVLAKGLIVASVAATVGIALGARPGLAHNDWGLPLVGGLAGGFALSSMMHQREGHPVYAAAGLRGPGLRRPGADLRGAGRAGRADRPPRSSISSTSSMIWLPRATSPRASTRPAARRC